MKLFFKIFKNDLILFLNSVWVIYWVIEYNKYRVELIFGDFRDRRRIRE